MNLIVDIGNTSIKIAVVENDIIIESFRCDNSNVNNLFEKIIDKYNGINQAIVSSVGANDIAIYELLRKHVTITLELTYSTPLPIENLYDTPQTLGLDRIAAAIGANRLFPSSNLLIVDLGTAITFDIVNEQNQYVGGNISPGIAIRFKALHAFTTKLPHITTEEAFEFNSYLHDTSDIQNITIGKTTKSAITFGVLSSVLFEINGYIAYCDERLKNLQIILTGGDAFFFDRKLKKTNFADSDLVIRGLNAILEYNVDTQNI